MELTDLEIRRRRALFRATHRGTKEMDWLLGRYAEAQLAAMDEVVMAEFEQFLSISDPDLNGRILNPASVKDKAFGPLVDRIRTFHGLNEAGGKEADKEKA